MSNYISENNIHLASAFRAHIMLGKDTGLTKDKILLTENIDACSAPCHLLHGSLIEVINRTALQFIEDIDLDNLDYYLKTPVEQGLLIQKNWFKTPLWIKSI